MNCELNDRFAPLVKQLQMFPEETYMNICCARVKKLKICTIAAEQFSQPE